MKNTLTEDPMCSVEGCEQLAEFDRPRNLCEKHWKDWFNYRLDFDRISGRLIKRDFRIVSDGC